MVKKSNRQITAEAAKPPSFGSALDEGGFKPLGGRIKLKVGVDHAKLRRPPKIPHTTERQD